MHRGALTADGLLQVFWLQISVLVVAVRLVNRNGNSIEDICRLLEDSIHLLQRAIASFGEEEVDTWEHESVAIVVSM